MATGQLQSAQNWVGAGATGLPPELDRFPGGFRTIEIHFWRAPQIGGDLFQVELGTPDPKAWKTPSCFLIYGGAVARQRILDAIPRL